MKPSPAFTRKPILQVLLSRKPLMRGVRLKKCDDMTQAEYDREVAFANWYHKHGKGTPTYSDAIEWMRKEVLEKDSE